MADTQKKLRPFLENKLNLEDCPGLIWISKEHGVFKLPWYHFKDVSDEKKPVVFKVFEDWAKLNKKESLDEKGQPNYPVYKHNMRCALNKMKGDYNKLQDNSKIKDDPHIIFQFVNSTACQQSPCPDVNQNNFNTNEDKFHDKNIPEVVRTLATDFFNDEGIINQFPVPNIHGLEENAAMGTNNQVVPQANWHDSSLNQFPDFLLSPQASPIHPMESSPMQDSESSQIDSSCYNANYAATSEETPAYVLPGDLLALDSNDLIPSQTAGDLPVMGSSSLNTPETSLELGALCQAAWALPSNNTAVVETQWKHSMNVKISYGQPPVTMMNETVGENGCRIFFGEQLLAGTQYSHELYGPRDVTDLMLPIVDQCVTQVPDKQKRIISAILNEMDRGFTLTFNQNGDILAQRLCKSRVYFCNANFQSECLDRKSKVPQKVFDFSYFLSKLNERPSKLPPAHFYLTIGVEVNPVHKSGPMSKVLITVSVTHLAAEAHLNLMQQQKREQKDSMQPEQSLPDSMDRFVELYKGLTIDPRINSPSPVERNDLPGTYM
ncbi:hypothetical protein EGW08_013141 [Elysia chlorotica]|uniref:IRF tryptophan pentad repeat domain-containing protein n=1 Tax=Elysia chlorotica TaxID=188477 RepID=A0A3S1BZR6_ELYCH|nr:hypothetical protein EGW08_013141 [Elysia chlorotica]